MLEIRFAFAHENALDFDGDVPDSTTLCRFRNKLIELKLDKKLFEEINRQLTKKGFKLKEAKGAVIDATLIESANRNRVKRP